MSLSSAPPARGPDRRPAQHRLRLGLRVERHRKGEGSGRPVIMTCGGRGREADGGECAEEGCGAAQRRAGPATRPFGRAPRRGTRRGSRAGHGGRRPAFPLARARRRGKKRGRGPRPLPPLRRLARGSSPGPGPIHKAPAQGIASSCPASPATATTSGEGPLPMQSDPRSCTCGSGGRPSSAARRQGGRLEAAEQSGDSWGRANNPPPAPGEGLQASVGRGGCRAGPAVAVRARQEHGGLPSAAWPPPQRGASPPPSRAHGSRTQAARPPAPPSRAPPAPPAPRPFRPRCTPGPSGPRRRSSGPGWRGGPRPGGAQPRGRRGNGPGPGPEVQRRTRTRTRWRQRARRRRPGQRRRADRSSMGARADGQSPEIGFRARVGVGGEGAEGMFRWRKTGGSERPRGAKKAARKAR